MGVGRQECRFRAMLRQCPVPSAGILTSTPSTTPSCSNLHALFKDILCLGPNVHSCLSGDYCRRRVLTVIHPMGLTAEHAEVCKGSETGFHHPSCIADLRIEARHHLSGCNGLYGWYESCMANLLMN